MSINESCDKTVSIFSKTISDNILATIKLLEERDAEIKKLKEAGCGASCDGCEYLNTRSTACWGCSRNFKDKYKKETK